MRYYNDYKQPKMLAIFFWGFACGIPLILITTTLSVRLAQTHMSLTQIGLFTIALFPHCLKFLGGPLIEQYSIPILSQYFGRARSWMIVGMTGAMMGLIIIPNINLLYPEGLTKLFIDISWVAFCSTITDIAEAELRIELLDSSELAIGNSCYIAGFGFGEIVSGGFTLILAGIFHWKIAYALTACLMLFGIIAVSLQKHRIRTINIENNTNSSQLNPQMSWKFLSGIKQKISSFYKLTFAAPLKSLISFPGWYLVILIIFFYYAASNMTLMMLNPFYLKLGFSITQIGMIRMLIGVGLLIVAGVLGGILCSRYGSTQVLLICTLAYVCTTVLQIVLMQLILDHFILLQNKFSIIAFTLIMILTHATDIISVISYISLIASLCIAPFTATQSALLTSLMTLSKIIFSSLGGLFVKHLGWLNFFMINGLFVIPAFYLIRQYSKLNKREELLNSSQCR